MRIPKQVFRSGPFVAIPTVGADGDGCEEFCGWTFERRVGDGRLLHIEPSEMVKFARLAEKVRAYWTRHQGKREAR